MGGRVHVHRRRLGLLLVVWVAPPESHNRPVCRPSSRAWHSPADQLVPWRASWRILAGSWHWIAFAVEYRLPVVAGVGRVWIALHTRGGLDVITGLTLPAGGRAGDSCGHFHQRNLTASCTVRPDTPTAAAAWSTDLPFIGSGKFALTNPPRFGLVSCAASCLSFAFTSNIGFSLIASVDF